MPLSDLHNLFRESGAVQTACGNKLPYATVGANHFSEFPAVTVE